MQQILMAGGLCVGTTIQRWSRSGTAMRLPHIVGRMARKRNAAAFAAAQAPRPLQAPTASGPITSCTSGVSSRTRVADAQRGREHGGAARRVGLRGGVHASQRGAAPQPGADAARCGRSRRAGRCRRRPRRARRRARSRPGRSRACPSRASTPSRSHAHVAHARRARQRRVVQHVARAAERGHHAREALGRLAAVERALRLGACLRQVGVHAAQLQQPARSAPASARPAAARARDRTSTSSASRTSSALPAVLPSTWFMSVTSARGRQPRAAGDRHQRRRQCTCLVGRGTERAVAGLHVDHQALQPGGEFLRQDAGGDQRQRLDRAGDVADRVEPPVGRCDACARADDRAAGARARRSTARVATA